MDKFRAQQLCDTFMQEHRLPAEFKQTVNKAYLPLANCIKKRCDTQTQPLFVGINGCQGSGKSTMVAFLQQYLQAAFSLNVVAMSLDDFYLPKRQRQTLAKSIHPLFSTRGVPGTHDVKKLAVVLSQLSHQTRPVQIPRFSKVHDEPMPKDEWQIVDGPIDIVLLEGWCWGTEPESDSTLMSPVNNLEKAADKEGIWRRYVNQQILDAYLPLYPKMHAWVFIAAPSFDCVFQWRLEQEQKLKDRVKHLPNSVMDEQGIAHFIQYFQRLTLQAMATMPSKACWQINLSPTRQVTSIVM